LKESSNFGILQRSDISMIPKITGTQIIILEKTGSTNDYLLEALKLDPALESGTLVMAGYQEKGRGCGTNTWESDPWKNLLISVYYKPLSLRSHLQFYLNMAVSLGVHSFIKTKVKNQDVTVKWPNDLYINDDKSGGLLLQHTISSTSILFSIIGIGLNVNQLRFSGDAPNPVSLRHFIDQDLNLDQCRTELCNELDRYLFLLEQNQFSIIKNLYLSVLYARGVVRKYKYCDELIEARIEGISEYGALILEKTDGTNIECDMNDIQFII
jgi:BirA family transcriptional regulator, biotin operon repressor / biotin---[acetyl-CoA-carboxylase] ligase